MKITIRTVTKRGKQYLEADCQLGKVRRKYLVPAKVYGHLSGKDIEVAATAWATKRLGEGLADPKPKAKRAPKGSTTPKLKPTDPAEKAKTTFGEFFDGVWCETFGKKRTTFAVYRGYFNMHLRPMLGDFPISEFGAEHLAKVDGYLVTVQRKFKRKPAQPLNDRSKNMIRMTLKSVLNAAHEYGYHAKPPKIVIPTARVEAVDKSECYSADQINSLVQGAEKVGRYAQIYILLGADAGLRSSESLELKWSDIHWDRRIARIARNTQTVDGQRVVQTTKGGVAADVVLSDRLLDLLRAEQAVSKSTHVVTADGIAPLWKADGVIIFRKVIRRAKRIDPSITDSDRTHRLRKTCAVRVADYTRDPYAVQKALRHSTLNQSVVYVVRPVDDQIRAAVNGGAKPQEPEKATGTGN